MTYRPPSEAGGFVFVTLRDDASAKLRPEDWDGLNHAIDMDLAWFQGTDLFGDTERIRVADILGINRSTPEGIARENVEKEQARIDGGGDDD